MAEGEKTGNPDTRRADLSAIEKKWQKAWQEKKIFEADPDKRKKFFVNFPYPYINAYQHIGHFFTLMRVEALARYKRLCGFNVLFPQGWHATGSPILNAARRVKEREPKQLKIMKDMGFADSQLKAFEDPKHWVDFFAPEFEKDYRSVGMSVDWRRTFHTTSLNPHYDAFIRWQFNTLKQKGCVVQGRFPVVWDPKRNCAVGDHDRIEGEGEVPQEFCLFKFRLDDGRMIITATLRPDTVMGITNVYVNPNERYVYAKVNGEDWIIGKPMVEKLRMQDFKVEEKGTVDGKELVGQKVDSVSGKLPVLPATFLDSHYGTGMVHSVPSDSADDLIALRNLQEDEETLQRYGFDIAEIKAIQPISIFDVPELGEIPADHFLKKYGVKSQNERGTLEKIKKELYTFTFNKAKFNAKYKKGFSKDLQGVLVKDGQELIKQELLKRGAIGKFYELTGKVVSRSLAECVIKIVDDQWFLNYADPEWKKKAHKCLSGMKLYPEKSRQQFEYVIDWLHEWACTREEGLGTRLPWDEKWLIESLSDSTIYLAYYTISHLIKEVPAEKLTHEFFDYVFLGKGKKPDVPHVEEMKASFEYWYPIDFRNSGKDLIQNHLTFLIFNHVAVFPEDKWPKGIGVNGWVTVDGQKMSKSLGNMIPLREMVGKYSADASRITILNGGEEMDDPNWDTDLARSMKSKLLQLQEFCASNYAKHARKTRTTIDAWLESRLNRNVRLATEAMEHTLFRSAIQKVYFEMQKDLRYYVRRTQGDFHKDIIDRFIEVQTLMLVPFTPHICEEIWESIGNEGFASLAKWPSCEEDKIDDRIEASEELLDNTISDINAVKKLAGLAKVAKITIIVSPVWKYELFKVLKKEMEATRNPGEILKKVMATDLKKHGQDITRIVPAVVKDPAKLPTTLLDQKTEKKALEDAKESLAKEFGADVQVVLAEDSKEAKARNANPGKPAIVLA